jgi:signal transduction histidine kinase
MRRRLALAIAAVAAGAVVLFAVPLGVAVHRVYRDEDLLRLERDAVAATRRIDISRSARDPIELPHGRDRVAVYDTRGRLLAGKPGPGDRALARRARRTGRPSVRSTRDQLLAAVPLLSGERVTGAVVAARSGAGAAHDTRQAWLLLGALAGAVILAALAAAVLLGRGLSRPLERLAIAAGRLGHGDFTVRAPRSSVPEVDAVATALDATATRLGDLVARERAFSADASHQLRTPLAALRIELEAAELNGTAPDPVVTLRQVDRLEQTIATLLALARDVPRSDEQTDVAGPLRAVAHREVVHEILDVLLDNALRHGTGAVSLGVRHREAWLSVEVRDEGPGFGADPEHAFERGSTRGGHGIGLSLARSLAQAESGDLVVSAAGPEPVVSLVLRSAGPAANPAHSR